MDGGVAVGLAATNKKAPAVRAGADVSFNPI